MFTRSKDPQTEGKFEFRIFNANNELVMVQGGFETAQEADRAAERAHRDFLYPQAEVSDETAAMTDEEILAALAA